VGGMEGVLVRAVLSKEGGSVDIGKETRFPCSLVGTRKVCMLINVFWCNATAKLQILGSITPIMNVRDSALHSF
jgi:hypothetical protein